MFVLRTTYTPLLFLLFPSPLSLPFPFPPFLSFSLLPSPPLPFPSLFFPSLFFPSFPSPPLLFSFSPFPSSPPLLSSSSIYAFITETVEAAWCADNGGGGGGRDGGTEGEDGAREAVHPTRVVEGVPADLLGSSAAGSQPTCPPPHPLCPGNQEI